MWNNTYNLETTTRENSNDSDFNNFIHKTDYYLTLSDKEALKTIKEGDISDEDSEFKFVKGNHSFFKEIDDTSEFYKLKEEKGEDIEKYSKKQIFVSHLACNLIPVVPIATKDGKFYSKLVQYHENFSKLSERNTSLFCLIQVILFRDIDKPGSDRPNILGGVSFDFDYAHFEKEDFPSYRKALDKILENMHFVSEKDIKLMLKLIENFKHRIFDEEGKSFLQRNADNSNYKSTPVKQIQEVLLIRISELQYYLNKILNSRKK